jgi:hypothetical protein
VLGITGNRLECLGHGLKEQGVDHARILQGEGTEWGGEGKDDMTVGHIQEFPLTGCEPGRLSAPLTLWAVAIPAGVIADLLVATVITPGFVPAEDRRAALRDGLEHPPLGCRRHRAIAGQVGCLILDRLGIPILRRPSRPHGPREKCMGNRACVRAEDGGGCGWQDVRETFYHTHPHTPKRCGLMTADAVPAWNVFKQIFAAHWDGFKRVYPRYDKRYYDELVDKMLGGGHPDQMGSIE